MLAIDVETNGTELDAHLPVLQFGWAHDEAALDGDLCRSGTLEGVLGLEYASPIACCVHGIAPHVQAIEDPRAGVLSPLELAIEMVTILNGHAQSSPNAPDSWGYNSDRFDSRVIRNFAFDYGQESIVSLAAPQNDLMVLLQYAYWLQTHPDPDVRRDSGISLPLNSRGRPVFSLEAIAKHMGFPFDGDAHSADADARQTLTAVRHCAAQLGAAKAAITENKERDHALLEAASQSPDARQPVGVGVVNGFPYSTGYQVAVMPPTAQGGYPAWKTTAAREMARLLEKDPAELEGVMALPEDERTSILGSSPPFGIIYPGLMNLHWAPKYILPKKRVDHASGLALVQENPKKAKAVMDALFSNGTRMKRDPHPRRQNGRRISLSTKDTARLESYAVGVGTMASMQDLHAFSPFGIARSFECPVKGQLEVGRKLTELKWRQIIAKFPERITVERMLSGVTALIKNADPSTVASRWLEAESWIRSLRESLPIEGAAQAGVAEVSKEENKGGRLLLGKGDMLRMVEGHNKRMDELAGFLPVAPCPFLAADESESTLAKAALLNESGEEVRRRADTFVSQVDQHLSRLLKGRSNGPSDAAPTP